MSWYLEQIQLEGLKLLKNANFFSLEAIFISAHDLLLDLSGTTQCWSQGTLCGANNWIRVGDASQVPFLTLPYSLSSPKNSNLNTSEVLFLLFFMTTCSALLWYLLPQLLCDHIWNDPTRDRDHTLFLLSLDTDLRTCFPWCNIRNSKF